MSAGSSFEDAWRMVTEQGKDKKQARDASQMEISVAPEDGVVCVLLRREHYESIRRCFEAQTVPSLNVQPRIPEVTPVVPTPSWTARCLMKLWVRPSSTWAQIALAVAALLGLSGLFLQMKQSKNAERRDELRRSDEALSRLYAIEIDIRKFLCNYPEIREYLADDPTGTKLKELERGATPDKLVLLVRIKLVCGMFGNFFEYYLLVEHDFNDVMKDQVQIAYRNYIRLICRQSYAVRSHLLTAPDTWTENLIRIIHDAEPESDHSAAIATTEQRFVFGASRLGNNAKD